MSMTPSVPNGMATIRSFWQRPEGKTGAVVLVGTGIAGVYGMSLALPWAIAFATDMLHLGILVGGLFVALYIVSNKTFRSIVGNVFRLSMRFMTQQLVEIDPIGILKNNLDKMREQSEELGKGVAGCAGAKTQLENQIANNQKIVRHAQSLADQADLNLNATNDPLQKQRWMLSKNSQLQEIGRRLHSTENFQKILAQTTRMYTMLTRWQQLADFNIENTDAEIKNAEEERKSILASYKALGPAQRLIKGDPEQLKMVNASLEYLAEDNANKLGAMEDFARYSEKFLSGMDLEAGANAADAEKMMTEYENKLLTAGSPQASAVPVATKVVQGDYIDYTK
jgi:hypothetical protein